MENAILDIQNVSVRFANGSAVQAVEQVSLSVFPSDKLCIIGETGSGKSILLLSVLRLLPASAVVSGDVCFHGQSLFALSPKQMDGVRGGQISYVPQGSGNGMNPLLSVGFQVGEPLIAHRGMNKKRAIARAVELMRRFHLGREEELARQYPYTLSGGMRQRALIAMGISADAELLLFDEPTKGLDEARIRLVADTLNELDGQTMVCVTHDLSFARDVANRIGVMYAANLIEVADADGCTPIRCIPIRAICSPPCGKRAAFPRLRLCDDTRVTGCKYQMRCPVQRKCAEMPPMATWTTTSEVLVCVKPSWSCFADQALPQRG
ncbi:MAG: ATP-binding cassette domain-containing protein [Christensenellales bacterium]